MYLTTAQAAEYLGVSDARIRQLIASDDLEAAKQGGIWVVSADALDRYAQRAKSGRPTKAESEKRLKNRTRIYTLMSRQYEVALVAYSPSEVRFTKLEVLDEQRIPFALKAYTIQDGGLGALNRWWGNRTIPSSRPDLNARLRELELESSFQIPFRNLGLSMSDQYWLCPKGESISWDEVNYYRNHFDMVPAAGLGSISRWLNAVGLNSPDNTTDGMLSKRWIIDESGRPVLIKSNDEGGRETINEVIATMLYRRLLHAGEYVEYRLGKWHGQDVSICESFLHDDEEFIPAWYVLQLKKKPNNWSEYRLYTQLCFDLKVRDAVGYLDRMLVCDSILANTDRHWGNFGIIRNVETLKLRPAPIFDSGSSLWSKRSADDLALGNYFFETRPFYDKPQRQLDLVLDGRWYHPEALDGFVDEVHDLLAKRYPLSGIADPICRGLERRIDVVNAWWRATPTYGLPPEWAEPVEMVEWMWV